MSRPGWTRRSCTPRKILPIARLEEEQVTVALDLIYDRRAEGYDPLSRLLELFEGVDTKSMKASRAEELAALPLDERLQQRIIDGERNGLEADLEEALAERPALQIVNDTLLAGMKVVGELFGSGQMQLPFVLQSAEVMKTAVAHLEPHMEKTDDEGKGTMLKRERVNRQHYPDESRSQSGYLRLYRALSQPTPTAEIGDAAARGTTLNSTVRGFDVSGRLVHRLAFFEFLAIRPQTSYPHKKPHSAYCPSGDRWG